MNLNLVFENAVNTAFTVFKDLIKKGKYISEPSESGWGDDDPNVEIPMDVIVNGLSQEDKKNTSFAAQIMPSDTIIMVKGVDIKNTVKKVKSGDKFSLFLNDEWVELNIEAHDTDPAEALFLVLLREA